MRIIIAGGGKVGRSLARILSAEGYDLTVIDVNAEALDLIQEKYDVMTVEGNCAMMSTLREAGIENTDILIAATRADEVNLLCCVTGHALNSSVKTVARIRDPQYYDQIYEMRDAFALTMTFNPELKTAREIARLLEFPGFLQRDSFARDRAEIVEIQVKEASRLDGVRLSDLGKIVKCRVLVSTVVRNGDVIMPDGNFVLESGDRIFVTAPTQELTTLLESIGVLTRKVRRVLLAGGGSISVYLATLLHRSGISVRILDNDPARCEELAEIIPFADISCADATLQGSLEEAGVTDCDAVVSLTGLDEMNIIISLLASDLGIPQVITKVGRAESLGIVDRLSVGSAVSPQEVIGSTIVRYVRALKNQTGAAITVHSIASGNAEASEFEVSEQTRFRGIPLKDVPVRKNVLLVAIAHRGQLEIPNGDSVFEEGDSLIIVTESNTIIEQLNDIFA